MGMRPPIRFISVTLFGTLVGGAFLGDYFLRFFHGYDHGDGETARCTLAGGILGTFVGLAAELLMRLFDNDLRIGMRHFLYFVTGISIAMVISLLALHYARS
jgi:hypothetical protein